MIVAMCTIIILNLNFDRTRTVSNAIEQITFRETIQL